MRSFVGLFLCVCLGAGLFGCSKKSQPVQGESGPSSAEQLAGQQQPQQTGVTTRPNTLPTRTVGGGTAPATTTTTPPTQAKTAAPPATTAAPPATTAAPPPATTTKTATATTATGRGVPPPPGGRPKPGAK